METNSKERQTICVGALLWYQGSANKHEQINPFNNKCQSKQNLI